MLDQITTYADELMTKILNSVTDDEIINYLIMLGKANIFIPVVILFIRNAKNKKNLYIIGMLTNYINAAYNPGLRAQIIDDFTRERLAIENKINELKAKLGIYSMEQQLKLYENAEKMLHGDFTTATTHHLMKVFDFRVDDAYDNDL